MSTPSSTSPALFQAEPHTPAFRSTNSSLNPFLPKSKLGLLKPDNSPSHLDLDLALQPSLLTIQNLTNDPSSSSSRSRRPFASDGILLQTDLQTTTDHLMLNEPESGPELFYTTSTSTSTSPPPIPQHHHPTNPNPNTTPPIIPILKNPAPITDPLRPPRFGHGTFLPPDIPASNPNPNPSPNPASGACGFAFWIWKGEGEGEGEGRGELRFKD